MRSWTLNPVPCASHNTLGKLCPSSQPLPQAHLHATSFPLLFSPKNQVSQKMALSHARRHFENINRINREPCWWSLSQASASFQLLVIRGRYWGETFQPWVFTCEQGSQGEVCSNLIIVLGARHPWAGAPEGWADCCLILTIVGQ